MSLHSQSGGTCNFPIQHFSVTINVVTRTGRQGTARKPFREDDPTLCSAQDLFADPLLSRAGGWQVRVCSVYAEWTQTEPAPLAV